MCPSLNGTSSPRKSPSAKAWTKKGVILPRTVDCMSSAPNGTTPAAWLARQRVIHAQRLLERTDQGLDRIAEACGFGSAAVLRQNFSRMLGVTPTAYRARFACVDEAVAAVAPSVPAA